MITMTEAIQSELIDHARQELPNECCGYITGTVTDQQVECRHVYKMTNVDASPVHFSFDPKEQFSVIKDARQNGEVPVVVYHSHPESPARLSNEDLRLLTDPNMVYAIVSLLDNQPSIRAYRIKNGMECEVKINIKEIING